MYICVFGPVRSFKDKILQDRTGPLQCTKNWTGLDRCMCKTRKKAYGPIQFGRSSPVFEHLYVYILSGIKPSKWDRMLYFYF